MRVARGSVLVGFILLLVAAVAVESPAAPDPPVAIPVAVPDLDTRIETTELSMVVTNVGSFGFEPVAGEAGLEWPRDSGKHMLYAGGLWIAALVDGERRVALAEHAHEFAAGPLDAAGQPVDPGESDPRWRVLDVRAGDDAANPDYVLWQQQGQALGAAGPPLTPTGEPQIVGARNLWCVFNDAVPSRHTNTGGSTAPIGVEVRQLVRAFDTVPALGKMVFIEWAIENQSGTALQDCWASAWLDPDLGGFSDDLVGCDPELALGYCYNATSNDAQYGQHPPALGCTILRGWSDPGDNPMAAFAWYVGGQDPASAEESFRIMRGLRRDGMPVLDCRRVVTRFPLAGDPVAGTGCLDGAPADRRFLVSTGPRTIAPGDVARFEVALLVGGEFDNGSRLSNVTLLRSLTRAARDLHASGYGAGNVAPFCDAGGPYSGEIGVELTFDGRRSVDSDGDVLSFAWDFGDGSTGGGPVVSHVYRTAGTFTLGLTVVDGAGDRSSSFDVVPIFDPRGDMEFTNVTIDGMVGAAYLDLDDSNPRALSAFDWGGRHFSGGIDTGCRFAGSTIVGETGDLLVCRPTALALERFGSVELRFDATQRAYRYLRLQLADGSTPHGGRAYLYAGHVDVPFTAWKVDGEASSGEQLQVLFTEALVTDADGDSTGIAQLPTNDGTWGPDASETGGHELLLIVDAPYTGQPDSEYTRDGIFFGGELPALFGGWLRARALNRSIDPADRFVFHWLSMSTSGNSRDAAWAPLDRGDAPDLAIASDGPDAIVRLRLGNRGDLQVQPALRFAMPGETTSIQVIDIDGDGALDVFATRADGANLVLSGSDLDDPERLDVPSLAVPGVAVARWADVDGDGDLDCFLGGAPGSNALLTNRGDLEFTPVPLPQRAATRGAGFADFDDDGDPDLVLANDGANQLFENRGGVLHALRDERVAAVEGDASSYDVAWADFDGDGDHDVAIADSPGPSYLHRNDGGGRLSPVPFSFGSSRSVAWGDFDNDADLDLYVGRLETNSLLRNLGDATFSLVDDDDVRDAAPTNRVVVADYDLDGDDDLFLANDGPDRLLRNEGAVSQWLNVRLVGADGNVEGIGARVAVTAGGRTQVRQALHDDHDPLLRFGLRGAPMAEQVEVLWPSGTTQRIDGVLPRQTIEVEEPEFVAVEIVWIDAVTTDDGAVELVWRTDVDPDGLGFHVWRAGPRAFPEARLTSRPVTRSEEIFRFVDPQVESGSTYAYRLESVSAAGAVRTVATLSVEAGAVAPFVMGMSQNAPNPFNPRTSIRLDLPSPGRARLTVYDVSGRVVARLVDGVLPAGSHRVSWDGRDTRGVRLGSGVFFYELRALGQSYRRQMVLLR